MRADRCTNCGVEMTGVVLTSPDAPEPEAAAPAAAAGSAPAWSAEAAFANRPAALPTGVVRPPATGWELYRIKPLAGLANATYALLGVSMLAALALVVTRLQHAFLIDDLLNGRYGLDVADDVDAANDRVMAVYLVGLLALLATGVVFIIWFHRARKNVELFGLHGPTRGAGWAIGGWFLPIGNFYLPVGVANDVWRGSDSTGRGRGRVPVLAWWWTAWCLWLIANRVVFTLTGWDDRIDLARSADRARDVRTADYWMAASGVMAVIAGVAAIVLVQRVTAMQTQRVRELWQLNAVPPAQPPAGPTAVSVDRDL